MRETSIFQIEETRGTSKARNKPLLYKDNGRGGNLESSEFDIFPPPNAINSMQIRIGIYLFINKI